jgi:hypothetical protein
MFTTETTIFNARQWFFQTLLPTEQKKPVRSEVCTISMMARAFSPRMEMGCQVSIGFGIQFSMFYATSFMTAEQQ